MADILPIIETLENRWMRAWATGDTKALKALTSRRFRMVIGSKPSVLLDASSWLQAANGSFACNSYRFGDVYARRHGSIVIFATQLELDARIDGHPLSGRMWLTDIWRKGAVSRKWRMIERILSRPEEDGEVPDAVRSLQLWRRPARRPSNVLQQVD